MMYEKDYFYHLYNRGCNKELIFRNYKDYANLITRMMNSEFNMYLNIAAYCLMPNHYHFLAQQRTKKSLTNWFGYIFNGYVQEFNKNHQRSGTLFEGRIKSKIVLSEEHLLQSVVYIHLNPMTAGLVKNPVDWEFSNYKDWIGETHTNLTDYTLLEKFHISSVDYKRIIEEEQQNKILQRQVKQFDFED